MSDLLEEIQEPQGNTELSERELEILRLLATGLSNKEIAARAFLSVNTVKVHLRNIFAKLGVQSRTEATLVAIQRGYITVSGTSPANGEAASAAETSVIVPAVSVQVVSEEPLEPADPAGDEEVAVQPAAEITPAEPKIVAPVIEIEPPLPLGQRLAMIGIALLALAVALIAVPQGVAQNQNPACDPLVNVDCASVNPGKLPTQTKWQVVGSMSLPRSGLGVAALGPRLFAIGGTTPNGTTGLVEIWNIAEQTWQIGQSKPTPVTNVRAEVLNGQVIVPGGYTTAGAPTALVEAYNPISNTWTTLPPLPAPRFAYASAVYNGRLYVFGGRDGRGYADSTFIYDPATQRWTTGASLPIGRGLAGAAVLDNAIYVVGGYANEREFDRCDRYLPKADRWEECAPMSVARSGLSLLPIVGHLYAIGGGATGYLTFNERYDAASNAWSVVPTPFIGQWRGMGAAPVGLDIYALGGWNGQYLDGVEKYQPFPNTIYVPATTK